MTISEALKQLYVAIGGDIDDVGNCHSSTEILNKFSVFLDGSGSATQDADAIMNIVAVAGGLNPTLIDKNITANGTYNAADDEADGYKKVVVDVAQENNAKIVRVSGVEDFTTRTDGFEYVEVPEGYYALLYSTDVTKRNSLALASKLKEVKIPSTITSDGINVHMFENSPLLEKIIINKPEGSITGAPWGAPASCQIVWLG